MVAEKTKWIAEEKKMREEKEHMNEERLRAQNEKDAQKERLERDLLKQSEEMEALRRELLDSKSAKKEKEEMRRLQKRLDQVEGTLAETEKALQSMKDHSREKENKWKEEREVFTSERTSLITENSTLKRRLADSEQLTPTHLHSSHRSGRFPLQPDPFSRNASQPLTSRVSSKDTVTLSSPLSSSTIPRRLRETPTQNHPQHISPTRNAPPIVVPSLSTPSSHKSPSFTSHTPPPRSLRRLETQQTSVMTGKRYELSTIPVRFERDTLSFTLGRGDQT
ncbi:hypothetical protein BLNAU_21950 [Blattamonas nauphoetae]|uniref:Uncharacterized protein n=1 Tax=Blattamonas nauphoetae TaxID=2049346 RepID=A0ABQ9WUV8_9EUKA|nr:hypothetical protein BLNAU_21950 [Blattamonas nauphoetae]